MTNGGEITTETGHAELDDDYVAQHPGSRAGQYVTLTVTDTGGGMDQNTLSHIFEPFFTTKGIGQGTGLGLSTVYGIVKQSEGYIWVYSEPGQGTTFKIYLPLKSGTIIPTRKDSVPPRSRQAECILVVEDEAPVRYMMKRALEGAGYRVLDAGNATEALDLLARSAERISLVLADVFMPGESGRELADRIGALIPGVAVLFTSGYTDGEIARRGLLEPGASFI